MRPHYAPNQWSDFKTTRTPHPHHLSANIPEREAEPRKPLPGTEKGPPEGGPFYLVTGVALGDFPRWRRSPVTTGQNPSELGFNLTQ